MQISSRFTVALHIFTCVEVFKDNYKVTSDFLAGSINTNPVIIRKILAQLKNAGLITVARGTGGITVNRPLEEITFYAFDTCIYCQNLINLFKKCINFDEMNRDIMWIKCENCGQYSLVKFLVQFGKEINKNANMKFNT